VGAGADPCRPSTAARRAHLGLETQREWSTPRSGGATPCLLGLFSLMVCSRTPCIRRISPLGERPGTPRPSPLSSMRLQPCAGTCGPAGISHPWHPLLLRPIPRYLCLMLLSKRQPTPLGLNRKDSQTAWLMISAGKRWRWYRAGSTGTARSYPAPRLANLSTPNIARRGLSGNCQVGSKANVRSEPGRSSGRHVQPGAPGQYWANSVDPDACSRRSGGRSAPRNTAFR
jgi:hypothetical protein